MDPSPEAPRARRLSPALVPVLLLAILLTALAGASFAVAIALTRVGQADLQAAAPPPPHTRAATPEALPLSAVAAASLDRVVTIEVAAGETSVALGTGWLLDDRGDYVTNQHVIADQRNLRVVDRRGTAHAGRVLGVDAAQDVAVVRAADLAGGTPLPLDPTADPPLPEPVVVLASARATGHGDRTEEQLVRVHQTVPLDSSGSEAPPVPGQPSVYQDMMVLKGAAIYRGNSGGPVLDAHGDVLGIVTLASETTPQAFAVPLARVVDELRGFGARASPPAAGAP